MLQATLGITVGVITLFVMVLSVFVVGNPDFEHNRLLIAIAIAAVGGWMIFEGIRRAKKAAALAAIKEAEANDPTEPFRENFHLDHEIDLATGHHARLGFISLVHWEYWGAVIILCAVITYFYPDPAKKKALLAKIPIKATVSTSAPPATVSTSGPPVKTTLPTVTPEVETNTKEPPAQVIPGPAIPQQSTTTKIPQTEPAEPDGLRKTPTIVINTPAQKTFPSLKVKGIIYREQDPSVIINDTTYYVGDTVKGVEVLSITRKMVTLRFGNTVTNITMSW